MQPKGRLKVTRPLIAVVGRRQEAEIWAGLKSHLDAGTTRRRALT